MVLAFLQGRIGGSGFEETGFFCGLLQGRLQFFRDLQAALVDQLLVLYRDIAVGIVGDLLFKGQIEHFIAFKAVAAASPSVWIHGWIPFARKHAPMADCVYLSLGDKEEHVKNQAIARVGDNLRTQYELLRQQLGEKHCTLQWEEGGHFSDNEGRLARAFAWCLYHLSK